MQDCPPSRCGLRFNGFAINARLSAVAVWSSFYVTIPGINNDKASRTVEEVPRSGESSS